MQSKISVSSLKNFGLVALCALGGLAAQAQTTEPASAPSAGTVGVSHVNLGYGFVDLDNTDIDVNAFKVGLNQNISPHIDTLLDYEYDRSDAIGGSHLTQHTLDVGGRYFWTMNNVKPYVEAGLGWAWVKGPFGLDEDSFLWFGGAGVEIAFAQRWSITPLARYYKAKDISDEGTWNYGVKTNWWATDRVGLQLSVLENDDHDMEYGAAVNLRF